MAEEVAMERAPDSWANICEIKDKKKSVSYKNYLIIKNLLCKYYNEFVLIPMEHEQYRNYETEFRLDLLNIYLELTMVDQHKNNGDNYVLKCDKRINKQIKSIRTLLGLPID